MPDGKAWSALSICAQAFSMFNGDFMLAHCLGFTRPFF